MDMSCFLKEVGLDHDDVYVHLGASPHALELSMKSKSSTYQPESPTKHYVQVEELPELIFYDQVRCISFSPCAASPKSVKPRYISWPDDGVLDFALLWNTYPFKALMDTTFNSRITRSPLKYIRCSHWSVIYPKLMDTTFNSRITRSPLKYIRCSHWSSNAGRERLLLGYQLNN